MAAAIDVLSAQFTARLPPVNGGGATSNRRAWADLAAQQRPETLGRLLEALPDTTGPFMVQRLQALLEWPEDPRLAAITARWLDVPPFEAKNRGRCFPIALQLFERQGDARFRHVVTRRARVETRTETITLLGLKTWKPLQELARRVAAWPDAPALSTQNQSLLSQLNQMLARAPAVKSPVDLKSLFRAVYARLEDDGPRLLLADALQEAGDPRGEFIALQLARSGPPSAREKHLQATWQREWLGPLEPFAATDGVTFARGFLTGFRVLPGAQLRAPCPEQATVETIRLDPNDRTWPVEPWLLTPGWPSLRAVHALDPVGLLAAIRLGPWPWTSLGLVRELNRALWNSLRSLKAFPRLTHLQIHRHGHFIDYPGWDDITVAQLEDVLFTPGNPALTHLDVELPFDQLPRLLLLASAQKWVQASLTSGLHERVRLSYDPTARGLAMVLDVNLERTVRSVANALAMVPPRLIEHATLKFKVPKSSTLSSAPLHDALKHVKIEER